MPYPDFEREREIYKAHHREWAEQYEGKYVLICDGHLSFHESLDHAYRTGLEVNDGSDDCGS